MKRLFFIVLAAALLTSCDPGFEEEVVFTNTTSHSVNLVLLDTTVHSYKFHSITTIDTQASVVVAYEGGIGGAWRELGERILCDRVLGDSVMLRFDDGKKIVYRADRDTVNSPYDFADTDRYEYEEKLVRGISFHGNPYYGKLTYKIQPEDYDRAE